mmetsp:Transcript_1706/g.2524  ORF Transcript_1706/g.2524 Transcript_1706/m.2524 type:complete len:587 (-) Transcript_1706:2926-4686(-)
MKHHSPIFATLLLTLSSIGAQVLEYRIPKLALQSRFSHLSKLVSDLTPNERKLQDENSDDASECSLCGQYEVLDDLMSPVENVSCGQLSELAQEANSTGCLEVQLAFPDCCNGPSLYQCQEKIRSSIFGDNFDFSVAPIIGKEPLNVSVSFQYDAVESIDVQHGLANIYIQLQLIWKDDKLAWNVNEDNCSGFIPVRASFDAERTEIWVPDLDLLNRVNGLSTFRDEHALVSSDGTVFWSRSGALQAFCQFTGLAQIPFDRLGCQFLLGPGNAQSYLNFDYKLISEHDRGFQIGIFEPTYNEYVLDAERSFADKDPTSGIFYFNLYFDRATRFYVMNIVVPTIFLTYLSFLAFMLDLRIGERLSYGMALALVVVAQQIITSDRLPISREQLWIDQLVTSSFYWLVVVMVESVVIGHLFFVQEDAQQRYEQENQSQRKYEKLYNQRKDAATEPIDKDKGKTLQDVVELVNQEDCHDDVKKMDNSGAELIYIEPSHQNEDNQNDSAARVGEEKQEPLSPAPSFTSSKISQCMNGWKIWIRTFELKQIDHACLFFCVLSYTIFIIVMFATIPNWGSNENPFVLPVPPDL